MFKICPNLVTVLTQSRKYLPLYSHRSAPLSQNPSVQLSPQEMEVEANPTEPVRIQFDAALAENPVDIYFVMDLSNSMKDHKVEPLYLAIDLYPFWALNGYNLAEMKVFFNTLHSKKSHICILYNLMMFFLQNNLFISKNGTQRIQKTNHYILLTNISIKRCIKTSFETDLLGGGGKSSNQTSTLPTETSEYLCRSFFCYVEFSSIQFCYRVLIKNII